MVFEAETKCRHELQAMRERHRERFLEATAKLRSQHKTLAKRAKALEQQLAKNSVSPPLSPVFCSYGNGNICRPIPFMTEVTFCVKVTALLLWIWSCAI